MPIVSRRRTGKKTEAIHWIKGAYDIMIWRCWGQQNEGERRVTKEKGTESNISTQRYTKTKIEKGQFLAV